MNEAQGQCLIKAHKGGKKIFVGSGNYTSHISQEAVCVDVEDKHKCLFYNNIYRSKNSNLKKKETS